MPRSVDRWLIHAIVALLIACDSSESTRRVIVLGFDGMDYHLTRQLLADGKLPNLQRLSESGRFTALETSIPPQSPVAWSDFITGMDAGGHGIFDFLHRDSTTLTPYLSTSRAIPGSRALRMGRWQLPLSGGKVELLRRGVPFWEVLEQHGIRTTIIRMPANFPPSGSATRELAGMGTPDLLGTPGTFSFFTTAPDRVAPEVGGGRVYPVRLVDNVLDASIRGPVNPFSTQDDTLLAPFTIHVDAVRPVVKLTIGDVEVVLQEGEWSDWLEVVFPMLGRVQELRGACRFYLKQVHPALELYATPINIDPLDPAMPISTPPGFARELARETGRFYTQGMPEETKALEANVFDDAEFLRQAAMAAAENVRQYRYVLDRFNGGFLFYYFGHLDQVSHMMWRAVDSLHPAHDAKADAPHRRVIENLYIEADRLVGETLDRLGDDETLIVMSDHGFTSWTRAFNVNSWLKQQGYIAFKNPANMDSAGFFSNVDWTRTQAYAVGLNGVYINLRGREATGSVPREQRQLVIDEIARGLLRFIDPASGKPAITRVYRRDQVYTDTGFRHLGPDLVIGFAGGVRSSGASALGQFSREVITDNTDKWSGDHLMDHEFVPGVLFSNGPLRRPVVSLRDLAAAVLAEFDIDGFPAIGARAAPVPRRSEKVGR